jgi:hypothetical protein
MLSNLFVEVWTPKTYSHKSSVTTTLVLLEGIVVSLVLGTSGDEFTLELVVVEIF